MDNVYKEEYARLYREHWWWTARERILLDQIRRLDLPPSARLLDFGCGDGLFLPALAAFGDVRGLEADASLVSDNNPYRDRIDTNFLADSPLRREQFDLITALDVLEHIEQDAEVLSDLVAMVRPGGFLLITVPASMWLWDRHDEINHHFRRYTKSTLLKIVPKHVAVRQARYLFHGLFGLKLSVGLLNRMRQRPIAQHELPAPWVSFLMHNGLLAEHRWLTWMRIPFGTSLMAVLQKPPAA